MPPRKFPLSDISAAAQTATATSPLPSLTPITPELQQSILDDRAWLGLYHQLLDFGQQQLANQQFIDQIDQLLDIKQQLLEQWQLLQHIFDTLPFAVLLLDANAQIVHHNIQAHELTYDESFKQYLADSREKWQAYLIGTDSAANHLTLRQSSVAPTTQAEAMWVETYQPTDNPSNHPNHGLYLGILPYDKHSQVRYIVYAYPQLPVLNRQKLSDIHDLTPTECRILQAMIQHGDSKSVALHCDITIETLRTHLKKILKKTHTHSQSELMLKIMSGSYWLAQTHALQRLSVQDEHILLETVIDEPWLMLGVDSQYADELIILVPSFFGALWDFLADQIATWQQWLLQNNRCLCVVNSQHLVDDTLWASEDLQLIGRQVTDCLTAHLASLACLPRRITLVGIHTGSALTFYLAHHLPTTCQRHAATHLRTMSIERIKLISPILPRPYMRVDDIPHPEYKNIKKAKKLPKKIWFMVFPKVVLAVSHDWQNYFDQRLARQLHETDKAKVRYWLVHPYLGSYFGKYCATATHKIAFEVRLFDRSWKIAVPSVPIYCIAGEHDIYTSLDSIQRLAMAYPQIIPHRLPQGFYSLNMAQWQAIFSL